MHSLCQDHRQLNQYSKDGTVNLYVAPHYIVQGMMQLSRVETVFGVFEEPVLDAGTDEQHAFVNDPTVPFRGLMYFCSDPTNVGRYGSATYYR